MKMPICIMITALAVGCGHDLTPAGPASNVTEENTAARPAIIYNDEVLCYASTQGILPYLFSLLRAQAYDDAIKITDPGSLRRHGKDQVRRFYEAIDVSYTPKLLSIVRYGGDSARLRYKVWRYATARFIDITTVTQDSVKIVLPTRLEDFLK